MYRISFQQIHYFLTVAKFLNFTEAAKSLFISQPALSKQIYVLEQELGFSLFFRNKRSVELTPEGESLLKDWSILENMMNTSIYNAKLIKHNTGGSLRIGCIDNFAIDETLSKLLQRFQSSYPNIDLDLVSFGFRNLREQFNNGELDVVFIPEFELSNYNNADKLPFLPVNLCIAVPSTHPLAKQETVTVYDLKDQPFITISPRESQEGVNRIIRYLKKYGVEPNIIKQATNLNSLLLGVKYGVGITICENNVKDPNIRTYDLVDQPNDSDIMAVWNPERDHAELSLFLNETEDFLLEKAEENDRKESEK